MQLGSYEIPEVRLVPEVLEILKKVNNGLSDGGTIQSINLAKLLGYKFGTESQFYRKIRSMLYYGLLEGKGTFRITDLGKSLLIPLNTEEEKTLRSTAVLHVPLWREIYNRYTKSPPRDDFWIQLMNITGVNRDVANENAGKILKWYLEDIGQVSEDIVSKIDNPLKVEEGKPKGLSSKEGNIRQMSQQMEPPSDIQIINFDKYQVTLPKGDLVKEWEKLQKYMKIKLEDYKYEESETEKDDPANTASHSEATDNLT